MSDSYEVTVRVRVTAPGEAQIKTQSYLNEWSQEGGDLLREMIDDEIGETYRSFGVDFEILHCAAIPTSAPLSFE